MQLCVEIFGEKIRTVPRKTNPWRGASIRRSEECAMEGTSILLEKLGRLGRLTSGGSEVAPFTQGLRGVF